MSRWMGALNEIEAARRRRAIRERHEDDWRNVERSRLERTVRIGLGVFMALWLLVLASALLSGCGGAAPPCPAECVEVSCMLPFDPCPVRFAQYGCDFACARVIQDEEDRRMKKTTVCTVPVCLGSLS